jgi:selenocysteine lyase/cysteine desulfurase
MVGDDVEVPLVTGGSVRYLNLDVAASAPCLQVARDAADALLPWYASVHRGAGYKSRVTTEAYEAARASVARFVGARGDDVTIFTRNTTDALNLLAACLPVGTEVVAFASEHHANLLPWRRHALTLLPVPASAADAVAAVRGALAASTADEVLLAVTGASNVTGELWPVAEMAAAARAAGARTVLDAAQLAPHHPVDIAALDVDWVALSGHKLYAPYGAGALVGRADVLRTAEPYLQGGGAARFVTPDEVVWGDLPDRQEAGSPNVVGAVALAAVCEALAEVGMGTVAAHEQALVAHAEAALAAVPGIERLRLWEAGAPRIGVLAFNLAGVHHALVAAALSAEFGIGVRYGWFCAHPMMASLLGVTPEAAAGYGATLRAGGTVALPSAVRASTGLGTTTADIDRLAEALSTLATEGPAWSYRQHGDGNLFEPEPDPRPALAAVVAARLVASGR